MPTLEARGVELFWSESGEGSPVLLVHETATTGAVWEPVAEEVSGTARAISYDRRGWGSSSAPDGYGRTTVEEQSEDAAVLLESLEAAPAIICGAGSGAVLALDLLLRRPEVVSGAVLVEPPLLQLLPQATEALSGDQRRLETAAAEGADVVELYLSGGLPALGPGVERLPERFTAPAREHPSSLIAELGMTSGWSMPLPRLAKAERPSVILTSPSTPSLVGDASVALGGRLAASTAHVVGSDGQAPHLGAPAEVAAAIAGLSR